MKKNLKTRILALFTMVLIGIVLPKFMVANQIELQDLEKIKVVVELKNEPLVNLFNKLENLTSLKFAYMPQELAAYKNFNLPKKERTVRSLLDETLSQTVLEYLIINDKIVVTKKKEITNYQNIGDFVQNDTLIKGTVRIQTSEGLELATGVSILEKGSTKGTSTNDKGEFSITVSPNSTLVFSRVGYKTVEQRVKGAVFSNIILFEDKNELDEVIITGYQVQEKREITGSISSIKSKDIENRPIQTFDQAMQGRMSGVLVQSNSGMPGGAVKVEIRGQGSITAGTQPLYVVDGVPINATDGSSMTSSNPLAFLNPNDIESIEVLKDAAAASIYGAQAANGVVLVNTKQGKAGPTRYQVNFGGGLTEPLKLIPMMNAQQYLGARMQAIMNANPSFSYERARSQVLQESILPINMTDAEIAALPSYDWQDAVFRTGENKNLDFSMTGGNAQTNFRLSGSYTTNQGAVIGTDYERLTAQIRLSHQINKKLTITTNVNMSTMEQNGPVGSYGSNTNLSTPQYAAPLTLPFLSIYNDDGSFNLKDYPGTFRYNSIYTTLANTVVGYTNTTYANLNLVYKANKYLTFKSTAGIDHRRIDNKYYLDPTTQEGRSVSGRLTVRASNPKTFTTNHTVTYNRTFNAKHKVGYLAGVEYYEYGRQNSSVVGTGFSSNDLRDLVSAAVITSATGAWTGVKRAGAFNQFTYNFDKKYMMSAILRYDGSSRFGENNKWGWFPAISLGWDIAQESFMKNSMIFDQLKLRAGYGETGNDQIGNFAASSLYSSSATYNGLPAIRADVIANPDLRWERNVSTNIGLDYSILKRRIYGSVEVFRRLSKDLLLQQPLPWTSGYASIYRNVGEVVNKGIELELNTVNVKGLRFSWETSFNITFLKNRVTKLYGSELSLPGDPSVRLGHSLQTNFVYQYAGVNAATGKPIFWDNAGNLSYSPGGQGSNSFTPYGRGNRLSDYFGGLSNTFKYKNLELDVFFQYDMGREMFNQMALIGSRKGDATVNGYFWHYNTMWTKPGDITSTPRPINGSTESGGISGRTSSTRYLEDASYIRLKHISLGYSLPNNLIKKLKIQGMSFNLQARNLYTWTKWSGWDPEFHIDASVTQNTGIVPQSRNYAFSVQVKF